MSQYCWERRMLLLGFCVLVLSHTWQCSDLILVSENTSGRAQGKEWNLRDCKASPFPTALCPWPYILTSYTLAVALPELLWHGCFQFHCVPEDPCTPSYLDSQCTPTVQFLCYCSHSGTSTALISSSAKLLLLFWLFCRTLSVCILSSASRCQSCMSFQWCFAEVIFTEAQTGSPDTVGGMSSEEVFFHNKVLSITFDLQSSIYGRYLWWLKLSAINF